VSMMMVILIVLVALLIPEVMELLFEEVL